MKVGYIRMKSTIEVDKTTPVKDTIKNVGHKLPREPGMGSVVTKW